MTKRVAWISFNTIGRACVEAAAQAGAEVAGIVTLPGPMRPELADMCSFDEVAGRLGAELIHTTNVNDPQCVTAVRRLAPDSIWVVGWSQLVRDDLLAIPPLGTFGMHPTLLPKHRGRAPAPWTILMGLARTGATLFEIPDATADSGAIVGQVSIDVAPDETAMTLHAKYLDAFVQLVRTWFPRVVTGTFPRTPQDVRRASHWPRRTPSDGLIDWEMRAAYLDAWVRAQTRPYPGAFSWLDNRRLVIWRARPETHEHIVAAGTVLERRSDGVLVACGQGALVVQEASIADGAPLVGAPLQNLLREGVVLG